MSVIDFQDLRSGPDSYDLASLLWSGQPCVDVGGSGARSRDPFASAPRPDSGSLAGRLQRSSSKGWKVCGTFARRSSAARATLYRRYLPGELALVARLLGEGAGRPVRRDPESPLRGPSVKLKRFCRPRCEGTRCSDHVGASGALIILLIVSHFAPRSSAARQKPRPGSRNFKDSVKSDEPPPRTTET